MNTGRTSNLHMALLRHGVKASEIRCGAECGLGWVPLIDRLLTDLRAMGWAGKVDQIKEKFGTLRWYVSEATQAQHERIGLAEAESSTTCEDCGAPGKLRRPGGWMRTLCDGCEKAMAK